MKSWLAQGSSGRRVTLLPGTTFLHINGALGIDVIIIGVAQRKLKFLHPCKILTELCNSPSKNIPFFQNADSRFLMNTVIRSILGINIICRHHPNFRVANFKIFSKRL